MKWILTWVLRLIPPFAKRSYFYDVLKTFCGEVAVLLLVFPALDWYLEVSNPIERAKDLVIVRWSPLIAIAFFALAVFAGYTEKSRESIEKGKGQ